MDWLTRLPVIGPAAAWFFRTRVWRVYEHLDERRWTRLAAAVTFTSFLALFPMLAVGFATGAAFLSPEGMRRTEEWLAGQMPGISGGLDLQSLAGNAGTVGLVGGALLLVTGARWAGTLRESLRAVWDLEEDPGNVVLLKVKDLGLLAGLGALGLVSVAGSALGLAAVGRAAEEIGLAGDGAGNWLLRAAGYAAALTTDFLLLWYLLKWLPRVAPPRHALITAGVTGAVGFELLKLLLGGYLQGVAAKSMYGAFGAPVALLLWISFMTKLLLFCAAWTATEKPGEPVRDLATGEEALTPDPEAPDPCAPGAEGAPETRTGETAAGTGDAEGPGDARAARNASTATGAPGPPGGPEPASPRESPGGPASPDTRESPVGPEPPGGPESPDTRRAPVASRER
ncbi:YihY/virulence factor BrkB family protein [Streptomyces sp. JJ36]|uniref:YihY/virulence factor BrkB family protein n=1 Tax=Streptomyces sp. JJ36 TaxID=2736645 RepID=UPI001F2C59C4|nr:YhjD/YihY/BrkB family envelope integrity protein [Streptomyces sp. JJ36]